MMNSLAIRHHRIPWIAAIAMIVVTTIILTIFGVVAYTYESKMQYSHLRERLNTAADQLSTGLTIAVWNIDEAQINRIIESAMNNPNIAAVRLTAADQTFEQRRSPTQSEELLKTTRAIVYSGEKVGQLEVYATQRLVKDMLRQRGIFFAI